MTKQGAKELEEFLSHELGDFSLEYNWEWDEGWECFEVTVKTDYFPTKEAVVSIRYKDDDLEIELSEGSWYTIRYFDSSVRYFWMKLSPQIWND